MGSSYLVEVKPSVFSETNLTHSDFDAVSNLSLSENEFGSNLNMEFTSREDAESWVEGLEYRKSFTRRGRLRLHRAHSEDNSSVDAYLLFKPV